MILKKFVLSLFFLQAPAQNLQNLERDIPTEMVNFRGQAYWYEYNKLNKLMEDYNLNTQKWNAVTRKENTILDIRNPRVYSIEKMKLKAEYNRIADDLIQQLDHLQNKGKSFGKALKDLPPKTRAN